MRSSQAPTLYPPPYRYPLSRDPIPDPNPNRDQVHAVKARITALAAPSWTATAGPGMHALAEVEPLMTPEPKAAGLGV